MRCSDVKGLRLVPSSVGSYTYIEPGKQAPIKLTNLQVLQNDVLQGVT